MKINAGVAAATPDPRATAVARACLESGGNALEAAVSAGFMLCACYPHMTGLGGDALMLVCEADGRVRVLSGIGQAALLAPEYQRRYGKQLRGPGAATTVPGLVDAFGQAWGHGRERWGGVRDWAELLAPAIDAANGTAVSEHQAYWHRAHGELLHLMPGFAEAFEPDGQIPAAGMLMRQPALSATLQAVAADGYRSFYEGPLAETMAGELEAVGSPLRVADLAACRGRWEMPLICAWGDGELLTTPPPTQGVITQLIARTVVAAGLDDVEPGSADYYHLLIEAVKLAMSARQRWLADPIFSPDAVDRLLAEDPHAYAGRIDRGKALPWPADLHDGDTAWSGFRDAEGRSVSLIQSLYMDFGTGVVLPETGVLWHNRGAGFAPGDDHPNALAASKRPMHTLNPFAYRRDGRVEMVFGTQGGDGQPQTLGALITRMLYYGQSPAEAIAAPRFMLGHGPGDRRDSVKIEQGVGQAVLNALRGRGQCLETVSDNNLLMGLSGAVGITGERVFAHHDPRGGGQAFTGTG